MQQGDLEAGGKEERERGGFKKEKKRVPTRGLAEHARAPPTVHLFTHRDNSNLQRYHKTIHQIAQRR